MDELKTSKLDKLKNAILSLIGLFLPIPHRDKIYRPQYNPETESNDLIDTGVKGKLRWEFTMTIGFIPLGWIIIIIALIVRYI